MQQIAILMGCAILPHLRNLVEIIEHGKIPILNLWKHPKCCDSLSVIFYVTYVGFKQKSYNMLFLGSSCYHYQNAVTAGVSITLVISGH